MKSFREFLKEAEFLDNLGNIRDAGEVFGRGGEGDPNHPFAKHESMPIDMRELGRDGFNHSKAYTVNHDALVGIKQINGTIHHNRMPAVVVSRVDGRGNVRFRIHNQDAPGDVFARGTYTRNGDFSVASDNWEGKRHLDDIELQGIVHDHFNRVVNHFGHAASVLAHHCWWL